MLRKITLIATLCCAAASAQAQSLGDIRGHIAPTDNRSARFLNAYPQTEAQAFVAYQPVAVGPTPIQESAPPAHFYSPQPARNVPRPLETIEQGPRARTGNAGLLQTDAGLEVGLSIAGYHYQEPYVPPSPGVRVNIDGPRFGGMLAGTFVFPDSMHWSSMDNWFARAETRFSYASVDYDGSGTSNGKDDFLSESRLTVGHDFLFGVTGFSPYVGVGFRYLFNDLRGPSSTGAPGYRRQSEYLYAPLGTTLRFDIFGDGSRVSINGEYDLFLKGWQKSFINDIALGDPLTNNQEHGHGWRAGLSYDRGSWSIGPYFNYWNIGRSDTVCNSSSVCGFEPRNQTVEYGLKASYRFLNF